MASRSVTGVMSASCPVRLFGVAAIAALALLPASARADADGYIDNFAGGIRFTRAATTFVDRPGALKQQLDAFWNNARPGVCTYIWQQLNANGYAMPSKEQYFTCAFPVSGEMRAKALPGNRVGVKYVLHGVKIQSSHYPANPKLVPPSATYSASFDMEIGLEIDVSTTPFTIVGNAGPVGPAPSAVLNAQPQAHSMVGNLGLFLDSAVIASHFFDSWKHQFDTLTAIVLQDPANKQYPLISLGITGGNEVLVALDQLHIAPGIRVLNIGSMGEGPNVTYVSCDSPVTGANVVLSVKPAAGETEADVLLQYLAGSSWQDYAGVGPLRPATWKTTISVSALQAKASSWRWASKGMEGTHSLGWVPWCDFSVGRVRIQ